MLTRLFATVFVVCVLAYGDELVNDTESPTFTIKLNENVVEQQSSSTVVVPKRRLKILLNNPLLGWSHSQFVGALADSLVDAGHEVHMLTYVMNTQFGDYTGAKKVRVEIRHMRRAEKLDAMNKMKFNDQMFSGQQALHWSTGWNDFFELQADICQELLANKPLLEHLRRQNYDFGLSEAYSTCLFGIFKIINVRSTALCQAVAINSFLTTIFGIPTFSSFNYNVWTPARKDPMKMTFYERAKNFANDFLTYWHADLHFNKEQPVFDAAFGAAAPSLRAVMKNVSLAFINSKDLFDLPRAYSKKIIYVGGITAKDEKAKKPLPENFKSIIESAPKGAVLFSFGTFADTRKMPEELKMAFVRAFAKFPDYAFIWKFNARENETLKVSSNVHLFDWVPQNQILEHPRLRAFISHCGLNSANEAAKVGVPVLGMPLFADQPYNAALIANKGFGLSVNVVEVRRRGSVVVEEALQKLLNDPSYAEKGRILSRKLALTPFSPRERFVKWVEFAAEFPDLNEFNMPTGDEMSVFVYYSLDVIAAIVLFLAVLVFIFVRALLWMRSLARRRFYSPKISNGVANRKKIN